MPTVRLRRLFSRPDVVAVAFVGLLLRCWVLLTPSGVLNADEAVTGLSALDISQARLGILIPDSYYTALVESYLFAPFVQVFGTHIVLLKLMGVALWFGASLVGGAIAARLGGLRSAVVTFSLLWLVPGAMMVISTRAYLAYPGGVLVVFLAILTLVRIAQEGTTRRTAALAGALIGLAFMMHPIYLGGLGPAAAVVTWKHRRALKEWYLPAGIGFLVGCGPWLWWNARNEFKSFSERDTEPSTYLGRLRGNFTQILPRDLGLKNPGGGWVPGTAIGVVLLVVVGTGFVWAVVRLWRRDLAGRVVAAMAGVSWFTLAVFAHTSFVEDGRYGILPFPITVVAFGTALGSIGAHDRARIRRRLPALVVIGWALVLVLPYHVEVIGTKLSDPNATPTQIARELEARGVNHLIGDYFDVLQVSYLTGGHIATKVFFPWPVRYPHLEERVDAASPDRVAIIFKVGAMKESDLKLPLTAYERIDLPGYELYVPYEGTG